MNKRFGLNFSYVNSDLNLDKKLSLQQNAKPLKLVLDELSEKTGLQWKQVGAQIVLRSKLKKTSATEEQPQKLLQTIRGVVIDEESGSPIPGVTVQLRSVSPLKGTSTNVDGVFRFSSVPVGRHEMEFSGMGYKKVVLPQILLTAGKELVLSVAMTESVTDLQAVVITGSKDPQKSLNDLASVSARSFTVEETGRYAASFFDPARMALSLAGVTAGNDINNDIVIRGNSSKGLQWRLEGVEIINPNHFGEEGSSAGGVSMISSSMLSTSDFFTGAFPAEYGNALSGVFDLQFRKGNTEQKEYSFMVGLLGTEASMEGPFKKGGKSSYLVNYRYSTLSLLEKVGVSPWPDGFTPVYQDLAFNLNFPTAKAGTLSLFGIGGNSWQEAEAERDFSKWETLEDKFDRKATYNSGSVGLKHLLHLGGDTNVKNIISYSGNLVTDDIDSLTNSYETNVFGRDSYGNSAIRYSGMLNHKINPKNTIRTGAIVSLQRFDLSSLSYKSDIKRLSRILDAKGEAWNSEAYGQWKHRFNDRLSVNTGLHLSYFNLSESFNIEPRLGLNWWVSANEQLSFGAGLHSRLEPMAFYYAKNELPDGSVASSNSNLSPTQALHLVGGYERSFPKMVRLKAEAYYQHLFNVPVSKDPSINFSTLNTANAYMIYNRNYRGLINKGTGTNVGLELTLEKPLNNGYYFLVTSSIFDSQFENSKGRRFSTDFNSNFIGNLVSGKEWKTGTSGKNLLGLNTKLVYTGGRRYTPINFEKSLQEDYHTVYEDKINTLRTSPYYRLDLSMTYRINRPKLTHAIFLDIQNVTNRLNEQGKFYNADKNNIETITLAGMIPSVYYRIEF
ncbi:carboxypeptidase regulatory-like domain-containing protein [Pedobacter sp. SYSU D00535]|uniref:carboxypeptidase regulatory-like domain-containing protein n=1 Tax=Pedobacter sp. SYSU D00535 TaxID=2810308 RepID=UPI001A96EE4C|nr:carboxypeptidase regulatory-like domain-containing protein [Pedobacter sp. SYSU D00535]